MENGPFKEGTGPENSPDPVTSTFSTHPISMRGLTLEAARWTLSREHMQSIVSKAVRQSADTSSLRLLPPPIANGELPAEMLRLDARQRTLKEEHILQSRRREALFSSLSTEPNASTDILKKRIEELQVLTEDIDRIAAELYHTQDQVAQLRQLAETHSRSALALALRMLNASALQSSTEAQSLRSRVAAQAASHAHGVFDPSIAQSIINS